jgi:hypothetical protein
MNAPQKTINSNIRLQSGGAYANSIATAPGSHALRGKPAIRPLV